MCVFVYLTHISYMYVHIVSPLSLLMHTCTMWVPLLPAMLESYLVALQPYLDLLESLLF